MKLRIWWIPQVPGKAFHVEVANVVEAKLLLNTLADYDLFQLENRIKGDYANVGGLEYFDEEEQEWVSYYLPEELIKLTDYKAEEIEDLTLEQVREFYNKGYFN